MQPKEDNADKADRLRERKLSLLERRRSAEENASGLSTDLGSVYGLEGIPLLGSVGKAKAKTVKKPITPTENNGIH